MVTFLYFCMVILFSMVLLHPVFLGISFAGALTYSFRLTARRGMRFVFLYLVPMMGMAALVNPLFNHRGMTILFYFHDNPITLESIQYGIAVGVMFGAVILWFSCFHVVMTTDKILHVFAPLAPSVSLILSMALRFVPRFKTELLVITKGQRSIGKDVRQGPIRERMRNGLKILSILVTWALENSMDTADSMKARGYGLPGRTTYSIFQWSTRDKAALFGLGLLAAGMAIGTSVAETTVEYFPQFIAKDPTGWAIVFSSLYLILCFAPILSNSWEAIKWRRLKSRI